MLCVTDFVLAASKDDPVLTKIILDQFEVREVDESNPYVLDGQGWIGKDLDKLWFKAEAEIVDGETQEAELQALYSRAITPFWVFQVGLRQDFKPTPSRTWAVVGFQGLAPYFFEIDTVFLLVMAGVQHYAWLSNMNCYLPIS